MLECGDWKSGKGYFKFENMWFGHKDFKDSVEKWWSTYHASGRPDDILAKKLNLLKNDIKRWNKEVFGNLEERKMKAMSRLEELDHGGFQEQGSNIMLLKGTYFSVSWKKSQKQKRCLGDRNQGSYGSSKETRIPSFFTGKLMHIRDLIALIKSKLGRSWWKMKK